MPFHPVRIFAPSDDDCFFHVVAFFQGADIDDWRAAKGVREAIARGLARVFLPEPWNDLDKLTTARFYGVAPLDADEPALKPQHDLDEAGIRILAAYKRARAAHPQEFPQDIIDYIVWVQFSDEELQSFRWLYREARLALPEHAIWGDEDMGVACVEMILHTQIKLYALADDVDCRGIEDIISIAWDQAHGADRSTDFSVVNLLNVTQKHWDAVLFHDVEEEQVPTKLAKVGWMRDGDASWGTLSKLVNLPRTLEWQQRAGVASLDELGAQTRLRLFFENASARARKIRIHLEVARMPYENGSDDSVVRLPSRSEYERNRRYGWRVVVDKAVLGQDSAEGQLSEAGLSGAVPLNCAIDVVVPGDKEVEVSVFLPVSGGLRYFAVVTDALGTWQSTSSAVETHRMIFYNVLLSETLTVLQQADVATALTQVEAVLRKLYLHLRPIPDPPKLRMSTMDGDVFGMVPILAELENASVKAADYYPYFFNLAVIKRFSADIWCSFAVTVYLDTLIRDNTLCLQTDTINLEEGWPMRHTYVSLGQGKRHYLDITRCCTFDERKVRLTVPKELIDLFVRQSQEYLREMDEQIEKTDWQLDDRIVDQLYQTQLARMPSNRDRDLDEQQERMIEWYMGGKSARRPNLGPMAALHVTVECEGLWFARRSSIGGFYNPGTHACVVQIAEDLQPLTNAIIHEIGHALGLVAGPNNSQGLDPSAYFYEEGGPHCGFNWPTDGRDVEGSCVMFGSSWRGADPCFCPNCAGAVLRGDYSQGWVASSFSENNREELQARRTQERIQEAAYEAARTSSQRWLLLRQEWARAFQKTAFKEKQVTVRAERDPYDEWTAGEPESRALNLASEFVHGGRCSAPPAMFLRASVSTATSGARRRAGRLLPRRGRHRDR